MKNITKSIWAAGVAAFMVTPVLAAPGGHGTDILHFSIREGVTNTGVEPGATGHVQASQNEQGNANNQMLDISVKGLTAGATYGLFALVSSNITLTAVTNFTTDANGNAGIHYHSVGHGHGGGKGKPSLPDVLNPVSGIHELDIVDTNSAIVLSADFSSPDKLQLLVKREITDGNTNGVSAELMIKASSTNKVQFSLMASGLVPSSSYSLAVDDSPVQTNTSDAHGRLKITSQQNINILDVTSVALWDASSNVVVSTTLP